MSLNQSLTRIVELECTRCVTGLKVPLEIDFRESFPAVFKEEGEKKRPPFFPSGYYTIYAYMVQEVSLLNTHRECIHCQCKAGGHGSTKNIGFIRNSANLSRRAERLKRTAKIGNDHQKNWCITYILKGTLIRWRPWGWHSPKILH